jgi:hypothetical protein
MLKSGGALLGIAALLSGCGAPTVYYRHVTSYMPGEYAYAGSVVLDVRGNPYNVSQEQLDAELVRTMSGSVWGTPTSFVSARDPASHSPYKVVWAFEAPWYASSDRLCARPELVQPMLPGQPAPAQPVAPYSIVPQPVPPIGLGPAPVPPYAIAPQPAPASPGAVIRVYATLCRSDIPISYVYAGFVSNGPGDPAFRNAVQHIELALLPARNEHMSDNGGGDGGGQGRR